MGILDSESLRRKWPLPKFETAICEEDEESVKHKLLNGDAYCGLSDFDLLLVRAWSDTTCLSCWSARLKPCKRGHSIDRRRYNKQGSLICMDCVNISTRKHKAEMRGRRKKERLLEEHMNA